MASSLATYSPVKQANPDDDLDVILLGARDPVAQTIAYERPDRAMYREWMLVADTKDTIHYECGADHMIGGDAGTVCLVRFVE